MHLAAIREVSNHLIAIETPAGLPAFPIVNSIGTAAPEDALCGIFAFT
jgi:hypothetical protein